MEVFFDFVSRITGLSIPNLWSSFGIFTLIYYIVLVIALWKIFDKAGEAGWKAIIPIYNFVVLFKIVGLNPWLLLLCLLALIPNVIILIIFTICVAILKIVFAIYLSRSYGRGIGTAIGLFFLPPIFYLILGFGDSKYIGPYGLKG